MARITKKKLAQIQSLNKRIGKKKSNLKSRYGVTVDIPKINPNLDYKTREKLIKQAEKFLDRKNDNYRFVKNSQGKAFPRKIWKELKDLEKRVNKAKEKEMKKLQNMDYIIKGNTYGKHKDVVVGNLRDKSDYRPLNINLDWFKTTEALEKYLHEKKETYKGDFLLRAKEQYKKNYFKALINEHGDTTYTRALIEKLQTVPVEDFYFRSKTTGELDIKYIYDVSDSDKVLDGISEGWGFGSFMSGYREEYENFDKAEHQQKVWEERRQAQAQMKANRRKRGR